MYTNMEQSKKLYTTVVSLYKLQLGGVKVSPYSITEHRVPELIPVLGSQPAALQVT